MDWEDVYKVLEALVPLLFPLILGYGSVKWWGIFSSQERDTINKFVTYLALPLLTFHFTSKTNPFNLNFPFLLAITFSNLLILLCFSLCETFFSNVIIIDNNHHEYDNDYSITTFSKSSLTISLILGVPLANILYGPMGVDLIVKGSVKEAFVWVLALLLVVELRQIRSGSSTEEKGENKKQNGVLKAQKGIEVGETSSKIKNNIKGLPKLVTSSLSFYLAIGCLATALLAGSLKYRWDTKILSIYGNSIGMMIQAAIIFAMLNVAILLLLGKKLLDWQVITVMVLMCLIGPAILIIGPLAMGWHGYVIHVAIVQGLVIQAYVFVMGMLLVADLWLMWSASSVDVKQKSTNNNIISLFEQLMTKVLLTMAKNPYHYSCFFGFIWALREKWCDVEMVGMVENSIGIMVKTGIGATIFNMGILMALQKKFIASRSRQAIIRMVLKFIARPAALVIATLALGLHDFDLRVAILQAFSSIELSPLSYLDHRLKPFIKQCVNLNGDT